MARLRDFVWHSALLRLFSEMKERPSYRRKGTGNQVLNKTVIRRNSGMRSKRFISGRVNTSSDSRRRSPSKDPVSRRENTRDRVAGSDSVIYHSVASPLCPLIPWRSGYCVAPRYRSSRTRCSTRSASAAAAASSAAWRPCWLSYFLLFTGTTGRSACGASSRRPTSGRRRSRTRRGGGPSR